MAIPSLEEFLCNIRASCEDHAQRKGYRTVDGDEPLAKVRKIFGIDQAHPIGEILTKMFEFQVEPRKVLAEKIAGYAWQLWLTADK